MGYLDYGGCQGGRRCFYIVKMIESGARGNSGIYRELSGQRSLALCLRCKASVSSGCVMILENQLVVAVGNMDTSGGIDMV